MTEKLKNPIHDWLKQIEYRRVVMLDDPRYAEWEKLLISIEMKHVVASALGDLQIAANMVDVLTETINTILKIQEDFRNEQSPRS